MADTDIDDATGDGVYRWERECVICRTHRSGIAESALEAIRAADADTFMRWCNHDAHIVVYRDYECADECCA